MATKEIELENRTDTRWVLEHPEGDIHLGQSADRDALERDPIYRPSPVVKLTPAKFGAMPEHSRRTLDTLVARGDVQRREIAA